MFGKKQVFVAVLVVLALGSLLAAVAPTSIGDDHRAGDSGDGGRDAPAGLRHHPRRVPGEKVAGAVGVLAALLAVGGGLGLVLAGPIVNALNWHWLFWIPGIVADRRCRAHCSCRIAGTQPGPINWPAAVLLSGWLVALLVPLSEAPAWGWGSAAVLGLLVAAVLLAGAWVGPSCGRPPR